MQTSSFSKGSAILNEAVLGMEAGNIEQALTHTTLSLLEYRSELGPAAWSDFAKKHFAAHPLRHMIHESPFSQRSYTQPRGYAGDAVMLDYIYGDLPPGELSARGERVFHWERNAPGCESVRGRRDLLARYIDQAADETENPAVLAVACGHLRELALTRAWKERRVKNFTALDQDLESLAVVEQSYGSELVKAIPGSVRSLIAGKHRFRDLDLVYAAGLYDYLSVPVGQRLTSVMFNMLKPGGRLLVANFHPALTDIASMETWMNWWLIYRTESEMAQLSETIDPGQIAAQRIFSDAGGNLVYLEMQKG